MDDIVERLRQRDSEYVDGRPVTAPDYIALEAAAEIERLRAECEALRKDAEMLRYISAHSWVEYTSAGFVIHLGLGYRQHNPSLFLSLIDRAMASSAEGQEVKP